MVKQEFNQPLSSVDIPVKVEDAPQFHELLTLYKETASAQNETFDNGLFMAKMPLNKLRLMKKEDFLYGFWEMFVLFFPWQDGGPGTLCPFLGVSEKRRALQINAEIEHGLVLAKPQGWNWNKDSSLGHRDKQIEEWVGDKLARIERALNMQNLSNEVTLKSICTPIPDWPAIGTPRRWWLYAALFQRVLEFPPSWLLEMPSLDLHRSQTMEDFLAMCANVPERPALAEPIEHNYGDLPLHKLQGPEERLLAVIGVALPELYPPGVENLSQTEKNQVAYKKLQTIQEKKGEILMWFTKALPMAVRGVFWRQPQRIDDTWKNLKGKLASGLFSNNSLRQIIEISVKETASGLIRNNQGMSLNASKGFELQDLQQACSELAFLLLTFEQDPEYQGSVFTHYDRQELITWIEQKTQTESPITTSDNSSSAPLELVGYYKLTFAIYESMQTNKTSGSGKRIVVQDVEELPKDRLITKQGSGMAFYESLMPFLGPAIKTKLQASVSHPSQIESQLLATQPGPTGELEHISDYKNLLNSLQPGDAQLLNLFINNPLKHFSKVQAIQEAWGEVTITRQAFKNSRDRTKDVLGFEAIVYHRQSQDYSLASEFQKQISLFSVRS